MRIAPVLPLALVLLSNQVCAQGSFPTDTRQSALIDACMKKGTRTQEQCLCSAKELRDIMTDDEMDMVILIAKEDRAAFEARAAAMGANAFGEFARKVQVADGTLRERCGITPRS